MKIKFTLLLLIITTTSVLGQNFEKLLDAKREKPTILINENIIASSEVMRAIPEGKIKNMVVMKSSLNIDQYSTAYPNLSQYGLISCTADFDKIETKTQTEIKSFLATDPQTKIYVDGFLLMSPKYVIATKSIKEIELINTQKHDADSGQIINIWTLSKENRMGL